LFHRGWKNYPQYLLKPGTAMIFFNTYDI